MASYLETCVESVISQITDNTPGMEVILVDDGSTDQSGLICDKYEASIPFVKVIHQKNRGLLQARRSGYRHASGKYIINLDSDDILQARGRPLGQQVEGSAREMAALPHGRGLFGAGIPVLCCGEHLGGGKEEGLKTGECASYNLKKNL